MMSLQMRSLQEAEQVKHRAALTDRDARIARMQDDVSEAVRAVELQEGRLQERDEQIKQLSAHVEELDDARRNADSRCADLEAQLTAEKDETAHWKAETAKEIDQLDEEIMRLREEHERAIDQAREMEDRRKALDSKLATQSERNQQLERDLESARKEAHDLRQKSALKDLEIGQLKRAKEQLQDDQEMLNIALDSKQQEVEMVSRR